MFSIMALPASLLERLPAELLARSRGALQLGTAATEVPSLSFGLPLLERLLPEARLPQGRVTELAVPSSGALGTTLALSACAAAQRRFVATDQDLGEGQGEGEFCAFVDPSSSLYAPGVAGAGLVLERLLVVRPPVERLGAVTLRLLRGDCFALVVVDTVGPVGRHLHVDLALWTRRVRQIALEIEGSRTAVLLLTDQDAPRRLPLPVARRIELRRPEPDRLQMRVQRDRFGHITGWRSIPWPGISSLAKSRAREAHSRSVGAG